MDGGGARAIRELECRPRSEGVRARLADLQDVRDGRCVRRRRLGPAPVAEAVGDLALGKVNGTGSAATSGGLHCDCRAGLRRWHAGRLCTGATARRGLRSVLHACLRGRRRGGSSASGLALACIGPRGAGNRSVRRQLTSDRQAGLGLRQIVCARQERALGHRGEDAIGGRGPGHSPRAPTCARRRCAIAQPVVRIDGPLPRMALQTARTKIRSPSVAGA